jgi:ABC-type nitrate/sulfonate/bicarbonate transport system permease component
VAAVRASVPPAISGRQAADAVLFVAALAALWQGAHELVGKEGLASPLATFARAGALLGSASFWPHAGATGLAFVYALAVALAGGLASIRVRRSRSIRSSCCCSGSRFRPRWRSARCTASFR